MDNQEKAMQIAKEDGADFIQSKPDWNDQEVWLIGYGVPGGEVECIGYPEYAVFDNGNVRILEPNEARQYMRYLDDRYGSDGDELGYEDKEPITVI